MPYSSLLVYFMFFFQILLSVLEYPVFKNDVFVLCLSYVKCVRNSFVQFCYRLSLSFSFFK